MSKIVKYILISACFFFSASAIIAQDKKVVEESLKEYIRENHLEKIEEMIHKLSSSKEFLNQFLDEEERHKIDVSNVKRRDIKIGKDIDVFVKHFTEHQSFTMILVPINIYSLAIYDTLLFSVIEVTDDWLQDEFPYEDFKNDSLKSALLSLKNHDLLAEHLYDQSLKGVRNRVGEFKIDLRESYVTTNTIHQDMGELTKQEKEAIRRRWGMLKKAFSHSVNLNIELNIYVFGFNDLEVLCKNKKGEISYKITPQNIFMRHQFEE